MIKSFSHKGLEKFFIDGVKKGIQAKHAERLADMLDLLDAAKIVSDMNFPGSNLHPLRGKLKGFWAVKVSGNWRVIFISLREFLCVKENERQVILEVY